MGLLVGILYGLVPEGRWRQIGKWVTTVLVTRFQLAGMRAADPAAILAP